MTQTKRGRCADPKTKRTKRIFKTYEAMKITIKDEKDGRCQTCQHCKRIAEKEYRTYCFAPLLNKKGKRRTPFEVQTHFKCSNGMYKFYEL